MRTCQTGVATDGRDTAEKGVLSSAPCLSFAPLRCTPWSARSQPAERKRCRLAFERRLRSRFHTSVGTAYRMHARVKQTPAETSGTVKTNPATPATDVGSQEASRLPVLPQSAGKPKVLAELRPCFEGFSGIPQETRLIYSLLAASRCLEVGGLLNTFTGSRSHFTRTEVARNGEASLASLVGSRSRYRQARAIVSLDRANHDPQARSPIQRFLRKGGLRMHVHKALYMLGKRDQGHLLEIDAQDFGDALWTQLFAKTLSAVDRRSVLGSRFFATSSSWDVAGYFCRSKRYAQHLNSEGWDFLLCQTGCPYRLSPGTRAVVRYHDAIPVFYPHTIPDQYLHLKKHYDVLRASIDQGAFFACVSEPVRDDLLRLAPEAEACSVVLPDIVSPEFRPTPQPKESVVESIALRECPATLHKPRTNLSMRIRRLMADAALDRYVMAVSTLEPRKNYGLLLRAFEEANRRGTPFRLIMVAHPGWRCDDLLDEVRRLVAAGSVMHLVNVPLEELRVLYSNAHAVICPSRSEGFDLSGVEAMLCGTPVIASDIPVHRWVYGDAAHYFDTYDVGALTRSLVELMSLSRDEGELAELRSRGQRQAQLYTPSAIGPKWETLFDRLMAEKRNARRTAAGGAT